MSAGITVYNGAAIQFTTQYPALLVDRTNKYGYKNYQITFSADPPQPPAPTTSTNGTVYQELIPIYHGLGYIPAFETVTVGYGLPATVWNTGISMWNEDAMLSQGSPTGTDVESINAINQLIFRADQQNLHIGLYRVSVWDFGYATPGPAYPFSLSGVQLNINVQIFAMGLNDSLSQV
jgi:hypothetical protein